MSLSDFVTLSKQAGTRLDWTQAGGGNTSIKLSPTVMLIKASGFSLSEVDEKKGWIEVNPQIIAEVLNQIPDHLSASEQELFGKTQLGFDSLPVKPSIEVYLHALLGKVVLHSHPWVISALACQKNWKELWLDLYPDSLTIDYATPGVPLGLALKRECSSSKKSASIGLLQNHGLIVSGDSIEEVMTLQHQVTDRCASYLNVDLSDHHTASRIQTEFYDCTQQWWSVVPVQNATILAYIQDHPEWLVQPPLFPDQVIYGGFSIPTLTPLHEKQGLLAYYQKHQVWPRFVVAQSRLYSIAQTVKKARDNEDVLLAHFMTLALSPSSPQELDSEELHYLVHWEAEKWRQNLQQ